MSDKVTVIARIAVKPDVADQAAEVLAGLVEAARDEAGTELYVLHREGEATFWFYELYADQSAFQVHSKSPALAEAFGVLGAMLDGAPHLTVATPVVAKGLDV